MSPMKQETAAPTTIVTTSGVKVVVQPTPPPVPVAPREPWPPERGPRVVVRPPPDPHAARNAAVHRIYQRDGLFLLRLLTRARVNPASAEELSQEVLIVLTEYLDTHEEPIRDDRAYLTAVAQGFLKNRRRRARLDVDPEADAADAIDPVSDPELLVHLVQRSEALNTALAALPALLQTVVRSVDLDENTVEETAARLGRSRGTVSTQLTRGRELLGKLLRASARRTP
jgi:RNA polymerase sigma factor (sigma-70 family)